MNHSTFHIQKPSSQKPQKHTTKRLTEDQVRLLESSFDSSKKLEPERKHQLSRQLGVPPRQIAIWYQNKRARWKNQSLEHDYTILQLQLEATLAETRHLQKEVEQLKFELNKVQAEQTRQHKYYDNSTHRPLMDSSYSKCGEEVGSSSRSLDDDVNNLYCYGQQVYEVEEMYATACMMGSDLGLFGPKKNLF
uniref:homeobox-leucine zipper protein ATHB-52-like n=1 Tax=Erigeron canadensis TaxID=72917 RepID=UPI001CB8A219|nr:homeobox-leucine zipper protein ATHB-52-like [Erigeron canadensis]